MLNPDVPALLLAPMEGVTDAPMRALQGELGVFSFAVSEFVRVSGTVIPQKVFRRDVPELMNGGRTVTGLPVQVQLLGGDPERVAASALNACHLGATGIDLNFGCPAPAVNRHDGGASLLREPNRIRELVRAVREAVPDSIPVSAKLRLGWESIEDIHRNADCAAEGGASWIAIHARTRTQGYRPPVYWEPIGEVRRRLSIPVIANGDIWTVEDFLRCQEVTGSIHFMLGRGALAEPSLARDIADRLGLPQTRREQADWPTLFSRLVDYMDGWRERGHGPSLMRLKQWMKLAHSRGTFPYFHELKQSRNLEEFFGEMRRHFNRSCTLTSI